MNRAEEHLLHPSELAPGHDNSEEHISNAREGSKPAKRSIQKAKGARCPVMPRMLIVLLLKMNICYEKKFFLSGLP
jgi:hypothetical protein